MALTAGSLLSRCFVAIFRTDAALMKTALRSSAFAALAAMESEGSPASHHSCHRDNYQVMR
jgi:hypothetical protein